MTIELRYQPSVDQRALADTFNASLQGLLPLERLRHGRFETDATWAQLEDAGLFTIAVPEAEGGSGLGAAEEALIALELGRCLAAPAVFATLAATHARAPSPGDATLQRTRYAYRNAGHLVLVDDGVATRTLVRDVQSAALHEGATASHVIDAGLWNTTLRRIDGDGKPLALFDAAALQRLRLLDAAALAGLADAALAMAVAYAGERRQFGRAIGSFQAVKHHCANMAIGARNACDQVTFAAVAIDEGRPDAALQVDCAVHVAGNAALRNSALNIQVHGGIGFSEEAYPHLLLKRAQVWLALCGGAEASLARIAAAHAPALQ